MLLQVASDNAGLPDLLETIVPGMFPLRHVAIRLFPIKRY
jgi:hypothetical protein